VGIDDLRDDAPVPQTRQRELAQWSLVMLRLTLLSDIGYLAPDSDDVAVVIDTKSSHESCTAIRMPRNPSPIMCNRTGLPSSARGRPSRLFVAANAAIDSTATARHAMDV
jgi:hypothetical protein